MFRVVAAGVCALVASDTFAAGISRYGVADLRRLAEDTHDFEGSYHESLVGPLPEAEEIYIERSPLSHLERRVLVHGRKTIVF